MSGPNLSSVVRPFQTQDMSPPERVPESQVRPLRNAIINVGAGGSVKTMGGSFDLTITFYAVHKPKEKEQAQ